MLETIIRLIQTTDKQLYDIIDEVIKYLTI